MRRVLTIVLVAAVLSTAGAATASAGTRGNNRFFYGNWRSHHRVDADTVDREYWYLDAYASGDRAYGFAYHTVYRCTTTGGKTQCRRHFSEYGRVRGLTSEEFSIDRKLTTLHFATTMKLRARDQSARTAVITLDLTGTGQVTREKDSYSYRTGCELYKFNGHSRYRAAEGLPSITVDGAAQRIGKERYASIGVGSSVSIVKEC